MTMNTNTSTRTGNLLSDLEVELATAVERSKSHAERVTVEVADPPAAMRTLISLYEGCLELDWARENDGALDVWAADDSDDGMLWRVRLVGVDSDDDVFADDSDAVDDGYYGTDTETYRVIGESVRVASHETGALWDATLADVPADAVPVDGTDVDFGDES